ncbi:MAG TPA: helix-turn-helix domain-containing protein [Thermomicrobiales bacterium]|nr:helix-turn-helix domain-containing protein [Thermomicrobiales bacterium]
MHEGRGRLADLVRAAREGRGWSSYGLAFRAVVDAKTVRDLEARRVERPTPRTLAKLAAALGLPLDELERAADRDAAAGAGHDG